MKENALRALKASIRHWERVLLGKDVLIGPSTCALCKEFYSADCAGCPVKEKTGHQYCSGTPYYKASAAFCQFEPMSFKALVPVYRELMFLRSLLPKKGGSK